MYSSRCPDRFVEGFQHLLELPVEPLVERGKAAAFALEDKIRIIQCGVIHQQIGLGLRRAKS